MKLYDETGDLLGPGGRRFTDEQADAVRRRTGSLLLSANAGSGKTTVLAERFVRSVLEDGVPADAMLAITFTEKAAGELRKRIRDRFAELGERERAREAEAAWISTIHGLCARVLRAHAVIAGLDPAFTVLDEAAARALRADAFDRAFAAFLDDDETGGPRAPALDLAAAWTPDRLRDAILAIHDELRSRGRTGPRLPPAPPAPDLAALRAGVLRAAAGAQAALAAAGSLKTVEAARAALAACRALLEPGPEADEPPAASALGALRFKAGNTIVLKGDACTAYLGALAVYAAACRDRAALPVHALLDELLDRFAGEFAAAKARASALDYDDLELCVRDLFAARPGIAAAYAGRFERVMVDELQDTNPLQLEILAYLDRANLFLVGDELQSIYGFRHADVAGFRRKREELPCAELTVNWRTRPEILETLNGAFGAVHDRYTALNPGRADAPGAQPRVELLLTDAGAWDAVGTDPGLSEQRARAAAGLPSAAPSRHGEARAVAHRVRELVDDEGVAPRDVAILLRAASDMVLYERALELEGLATLAMGGRGFWARQQVQDLLGYLGALANPHDEPALWTLLASPLVGLSSDALALLALEARGRATTVWAVLDTGELPAAVPDADRARLEAFRADFAAERTRAPRLGLDALLERIVHATEYDLHVLGLPGGRRRLANVHKLVRLATAYEARRGRDVRGFIDHALAELDADAREPDAPVELAGFDAVRLMTIHAAKGLEFPVVVVADLGRRTNASSPDLLVGGDRVGLRLVAVDGSSDGAFAHEELRLEAQAAQVAEERRVMHVALTRAQDRLVLSGSVCLTKPWPGNGAGSAPLSWLGPRLAETPAALLPGEAAWHDLEETRPEGRVRLRTRRHAPGDAAAAAGAARAVTGRAQAGAEPAGPAVTDWRPVPVTTLPVPTLSYSALASYAACGYRFYLQRVLRLPADEEDARLPGPAPAAGLEARLRGTLAHELLEDLDFAAPQPLAADAARACAARHGAELGDEQVEDLRVLIGAFAASPLCARLGACSEIGREQELCFELGGAVAPGTGSAARPALPLLNGVVDVRGREGDAALVVDYKTDRVDPDADLSVLVERDYGAQRRIYALAELRAGAATVEVAHVYLARGAEIASVRYDAADAPRLERELTALLDGLAAGRFPVAASPHRGLCLGCPGRRLLCSHDDALTLRDAPTAPDAPGAARPSGSGSGAPPSAGAAGMGVQSALFSAVQAPY